VELTVDPAYYAEAMEVVHSVLRRAMIIVQRYAQFRCNDLNDRQLKTEMRSSLKDTDEGVCLVVEFIPDQKCIIEAVRNRRLRKLIKRQEREYRRMERDRKNGS
jgi:hypothetical protein